MIKEQSLTFGPSQHELIPLLSCGLGGDAVKPRYVSWGGYFDSLRCCHNGSKARVDVFYVL